MLRGVAAYPGWPATSAPLPPTAAARVWAPGPAGRRPTHVHSINSLPTLRPSSIHAPAVAAAAGPHLPPTARLSHTLSHTLHGFLTPFLTPCTASSHPGPHLVATARGGTAKTPTTLTLVANTTPRTSPPNARQHTLPKLRPTSAQRSNTHEAVGRQPSRQHKHLVVAVQCSSGPVWRHGSVCLCLYFSAQS